MGWPVKSTSAQPAMCLKGQLYFSFPSSSGGSFLASLAVPLCCAMSEPASNRSKDRIRNTDFSLPARAALFGGGPGFWTFPAACTLNFFACLRSFFCLFRLRRWRSLLLLPPSMAMEEGRYFLNVLAGLFLRVQVIDVDIGAVLRRQPQIFRGVQVEQLGADQAGDEPVMIVGLLFIEAKHVDDGCIFQGHGIAFLA